MMTLRGGPSPDRRLAVAQVARSTAAKIDASAFRVRMPRRMAEGMLPRHALRSTGELRQGALLRRDPRGPGLSLSGDGGGGEGDRPHPGRRRLEIPDHR